jgi:hypothetical protein
MTEALEWAFSIQDRFSGPIGRMQAQIEKLETKTVRAAKQSEDAFAKAALRMQRENEKAVQTQMRAAERLAQKELREQRKVASERKKMFGEAGGAIGGALGGALGGRGGAEIGGILGGFSGGGFGGGALLGIGTAVVTTLIESVKKMFEFIFDSTKEISTQVLEHIAKIDATKFTLKQQLGEEQLKELERFNSNKAVLTSFGNNLGLLEEIEKRLTFATGGKLPIESIERTVQTINELTAIRGGGAAGAQELTEQLSKFAATGKIRPGRFFEQFFGGTDAVGAMFGLKGGQAQVRKQLEKMFTGGEIGFEDFINRVSVGLAKRTGQAVGTAAIKRATETISGAWERLLNLPQLWAAKMENNGAADKIIELVNKVFDALSPDSATGQKLYSAFDSLITKVMGAIDNFVSNPDNIQHMVDLFTDMVSVIPKVVDAVQSLVRFLLDAYNALSSKTRKDLGVQELERKKNWELKIISGLNLGEGSDEARAELGRRGVAGYARPSSPRANGEGAPGKSVNVNIEHLHAGEGDDAEEKAKRLGDALHLHLSVALDKLNHQ